MDKIHVHVDSEKYGELVENFFGSMLVMKSIDEEKLSNSLKEINKDNIFIKLIKDCFCNLFKLRDRAVDLKDDDMLAFCDGFIEEICKGCNFQIEDLYDFLNECDDILEEDDDE